MIEAGAFEIERVFLFEGLLRQVRYGIFRLFPVSRHNQGRAVDAPAPLTNQTKNEQKNADNVRWRSVKQLDASCPHQLAWGFPCRHGFLVPCSQVSYPRCG